MKVDYREVCALAASRFREYGYRNHAQVYNEILAVFGASIFRSPKLCEMVLATLEDLQVPSEWQRTIISRWFDDYAVVRVCREWVE